MKIDFRDRKVCFNSYFYGTFTGIMIGIGGVICWHINSSWVAIPIILFLGILAEYSRQKLPIK